MAGFDPQLLLGGGQPTLTQAPSSGSGKLGSALSTGQGVQPHHGLLGLVLLSVLTLFLLDKVGYRFFVTAGKR